MTYREFPPLGDLARIIECVWFLAPGTDRDEPSADRIFPDGATDIVVAESKAAVHGPAPSFRLLSLKAPMAGLRIRRGAARAVLGVGRSELAAGPVPLEALWGNRGRELGDDLAEFCAPEARVIPLARLIKERLVPVAALDGAVQATIDRMDRTPSSAIRDLARHAGLSERHLRRRFRDHVGLGIKHYARIMRFQRLLDATRLCKHRFGAVSPGWAGAAVDHGFADQAHLIREVKAFAGLTPAELLRTI